MFSSFEFAKKRIIVRLIILFFLIMAICAFIIIGFLTKTDNVNELKKTDASGGNDYMYDRIVAITFDDDVIIGLSQEISYKEAVSMI